MLVLLRSMVAVSVLIRILSMSLVVIILLIRVCVLVLVSVILLMLLPIALIFSENSMANLQTVSIIAAFPIGFIIVLIVWSFFRDARHYLDNEKQI